jgi:hypothetical protein
VRSSAPVGLALIVISVVARRRILNAAGNTHVYRAAGHPGTVLIGVLILSLAPVALGTLWVNPHGRHHPRAWAAGAGLPVVAIAMSVFALSAVLVFAVAGSNGSGRTRLRARRP